MQERVLIQVELTKYPASDKVYFYVNLEYRECSPDDFNGGLIEKQRVSVGSPAFELSLPFQ